MARKILSVSIIAVLLVSLITMTVSAKDGRNAVELPAGAWLSSLTVDRAIADSDSATPGFKNYGYQTNFQINNPDPQFLLYGDRMANSGNRINSRGEMAQMAIEAPAYLIGQHFVQIANDGRQENADNGSVYLSFTAAKDIDVYIGMDARDATLGTNSAAEAERGQNMIKWLADNGFVNTGDLIQNNETPAVGSRNLVNGFTGEVYTAGGTRFALHKKSIKAGETVTIPRMNVMLTLNFVEASAGVAPATQAPATQAPVGTQAPATQTPAAPVAPRTADAMFMFILIGVIGAAGIVTVRKVLN